ncbi:TetR/AcrR family transcriptional regulator [Tsukamurella soli]|uniref:TetR/AcrR family transcriptional regulator n=1 Tax=Tsukamurella soli TaxID=644556 RepID=A0ABP8J5F2_9ACTN
MTAAATDLFAERGPAATSIRQIADRAGVNQGLVFRHLGTKDQVVGAVLDSLSAQWVDGLPPGTAARTDPRLRRQLTVIARCSLDGYPVGRMQQRFPGMEVLLRQAATTHPDPRAAALATAHSVALGLGWLMFESFLLGATGLTELSGDELTRAVDLEVRRILYDSV